VWCVWGLVVCFPVLFFFFFFCFSGLYFTTGVGNGTYLEHIGYILGGTLGDDLMKLVHAANELVNLVHSVSSITTLIEVLKLGLESTSWGGELNGPEEVVGLLEVGANGVDFVNQVLNAHNTELVELSLNNGVIGNGNTLLVNLGESALVDDFTDGLEVGVSPGNVWLNKVKHLKHRLGDLDEHCSVKLTETQELEDLLGLGGNVVDTTDTHYDSELGLCINKEVAGILGSTSSLDGRTVLLSVLLDVLLGTLEDGLSGGLARLSCSSDLSLLLFVATGLCLLALQEGLWDWCSSLGTHS